MSTYHNTTIPNTALSCFGDWSRIQSTTVGTDRLNDYATLTFTGMIYEELIHYLNHWLILGTGIGVTVYGLQTIAVVRGNGRSTFVIDGGIPSLLETTDNSWCTQCPDNIDRDASPNVLYQSPTLINGTHTLTFTLKDNAWVGFDHFEVATLPDSEGSASHSTAIQSSSSTSNTLEAQRTTIISTLSTKSSESVPAPTASWPSGSAISQERPWISEPASIASVVVGIVLLALVITATLVFLLRRCRTRDATKPLIRPYS